MKKEEAVIKMKMVDAKFHRLFNKINIIEKMPGYFGTSVLLHPSEIHTIETIGNNPGINVTELAKIQGITKGAVSQVISKLEKKKQIIKMKEIDNDKKICLKLSEEGRIAFQGHRDFHEAVHNPIVDLIQNASEDEVSFVFKFLSVVEECCDQVLKRKR